MWSHYNYRVAPPLLREGMGHIGNVDDRLVDALTPPAEFLDNGYRVRAIVDADARRQNCSSATAPNDGSLLATLSKSTASPWASCNASAKECCA